MSLSLKCPFRRYLPSKPDNYGFKMFILADAINSYPLNIEIYTGKGLANNSPEDIVMRLASLLLRQPMKLGPRRQTDVLFDWAG